MDAHLSLAAVPQGERLQVPADRALRIVVFRALMLGDLLCAIPALRALRRAYPLATITLVGLPWASELVYRLRHVDEFIAFPGFPGLPEVAPALSELGPFFARVNTRRFDLALQLHGSGHLVNSLVAAFGATRTAAFCEPGDYCPDVPLARRWPAQGHEIERLLALTDHLGVPRQGTELEFPFTRRDVRAIDAWLQPSQWRELVVLHPGAQLASRRWPIERFAAVARALLDDGWVVAITGTSAEHALAHSLRKFAGESAALLDWTGRTTLWQLGAVVDRARLVIANDTGISHVAAATGTLSVIVSCGADVARWAPLDAARHRVIWRDLPCRPCGERECPTAHECAVAVEADEVIAAARTAMAEPVMQSQAPARGKGDHRADLKGNFKADRL